MICDFHIIKIRVYKECNLRIKLQEKYLNGYCLPFYSTVSSATLSFKNRHSVFYKADKNWHSNQDKTIMSKITRYIEIMDIPAIFSITEYLTHCDLL